MVRAEGQRRPATLALMETYAKKGALLEVEWGPAILDRDRMCSNLIVGFSVTLTKRIKVTALLHYTLLRLKVILMPVNF